jgi:hypothetical protein
MITVAKLSPSIHEAVVRLNEDEDDAVLRELHAAVKLLRENCQKGIEVTEANFGNLMLSEPARHKQAREQAFKLLTTATKLVDAAVNSARYEIGKLEKKLQGPPPPRDLIAETRLREVRDALRAMKPEKARKIINDAVQSGDEDDAVICAAFGALTPWLTGMSRAHIDYARAIWAQRHHPDEVAKLRRRKLALDASMRAGELAVRFVDSLTNDDLIKQAEESEKRAAEIMAAAECVSSV